MLRTMTIAALVALATAAPALAHSPTPGIDKRQVRQHERITQGVRSGKLTALEAARLRRGQAHIRVLERRARADGIVTASERRRIAAAQAIQNRRIYLWKHNSFTY